MTAIFRSKDIATYYAFFSYIFQLYNVIQSVDTWKLSYTSLTCFWLASCCHCSNLLHYRGHADYLLSNMIDWKR